MYIYIYGINQQIMSLVALNPCLLSRAAGGGLCGLRGVVVVLGEAGEPGAAAAGRDGGCNQ